MRGAGECGAYEEIHKQEETDCDDQISRCSRCEARLERKSYKQSSTEAFLAMEIDRVGICERCATATRLKDAGTETQLTWDDIEMVV